MDGRHHAISGLSMILNDIIKQGRNSHFIWACERAKMMTSRSVHEAGRSDLRKKPAGELKINADSQRAPLLGGRDGPFGPIVGKDPPNSRMWL